MKVLSYFLLVVLLVLMGSCAPSLLDEKIDPATLFQVAAKIRKEIPGLEPAKNDVLSRLETIHKGRETYQSTVSGEVVDNAKYNMYSEQLFNYFLSRGATYKQLFDEVEVTNAFDKQYGDQFRDIYRRIDVFCTERQNDIEEKERQVQRTIAELSRSVNVNIINISKTRYFQHESIEILTQITNTTSLPIEVIDFNLYVSKGGTVIAKLPIHIGDRFVSNKMKKFSYPKENFPSIFNALKNVDIYSITLKEEVYKINHDGKITDAYAITRGLENHHYKPAETLDGTCPYLSSGDILYTELEQLQEQKEKELADATPCLEKIEYIRGMLQAGS
ncbi:MAG: hypothetical protein RBT57_11115 [Paludibacter sp.]|jgi:hypothetical protein|nr:hypothetical protein [Paludibacter sp.]